MMEQNHAADGRRINGNDAAGRGADILRSAAALFAQRGVDQTTMREIADDVGIQVGGIYYYFRSKDLLLSEMLTGYLRDLNRAYATGVDGIDDAIERLRMILTESFAATITTPDIAKVYQAETRANRPGDAFDRIRTLSTRAQRYWTETIELGQRQGRLRSDVPTRVFHRFLRDAVWLTTYWHGAKGTYTAEELTSYCLTVFLDGMATTAP